MNTNNPRYKATHVTDSDSYDHMRGAHRTKRVHYVLQDGTRSYIEVPVDSYDADTVKTALDDAADKHERVMSVTPGYTPDNAASDSNPWSRSG